MKKVLYSMGSAALAASLLATGASAETPQNNPNASDQVGQSQGSQDHRKQTNERSDDDNNAPRGDDRDIISGRERSGSNQSADQSRQSDRDSDRTNRENASRDDRSRQTNQYDDRNVDRSGRDQNRDRDNRDRTYRQNDNRDLRDLDRNSQQDRNYSKQSDLRGPDIGLWFDRKSHDELVISDVSTRGAIAKLGFREGDRIVSVNGHRVSREADFIDYLVTRDAPRRVEVIVIRDDREQTIIVEPELLINEYDRPEVDPLERFGVILDDRYDDRLVVWKVIPRSPAYYAGIRAGDELSTLQGRNYSTRTEFEKGVGQLQPGEIPVEVRRGQRTRELSVDYPAANRTAQRANDRADRRDDRAERQTYDQRNPRQDNRSSNDSNYRRGLFRDR